MASKVNANDTRQFREKSRKQHKRKANEEEEEQEEQEQEQEEEDDDDKSPSNSEVERSTAQSIKAHTLCKQVQQEELTLR